MSQNISGLSSYYAQLAAQQQQGTPSTQSTPGAQGTQSLSESEIQQWLTSLLNGSSSTSTQATSTGSNTATCSGASSSGSGVSGQNLIQAMDSQETDNSSTTTQTASTDPATSAAPQGHHHHHHGGGDAGSAPQTGQSWFTAMDTSDDSDATTGADGSTTPASFASLLNGSNTGSSVQSLLNTLV